MKSIKLKNLVLSAMFMAIGIVLPFLTGQIKQRGNILLPMHIPVLLCGLICGAQYGAITGLILPLLRSSLFSMPQMYPTALAMSVELAAYGFFSGFLYSRSKTKSVKDLYKTLVLSMLAGRVVFGIAQFLLLAVKSTEFTFAAFISMAFVSAFPGIVIQFIVIPAIMIALKYTVYKQ